MNQILSVNNSDNNENNSNNDFKYNYKKSNGTGKKLEVRVVVIIFCVILIVFGCFIVGSGFSSIKNNSEQEVSKNNNTQGNSIQEPDVSIQVVSDIKINLIISHSKVISQVNYQWNDEEEEKRNGNGTKNIEISNIEVPPGDNKLKITVIDEEGNEKVFNKEKSSPERPWIKLFSEQNAIKVKIQSKTSNIAYVSYFWDNDEPKKYNINAPNTQSTLEMKEAGDHVLNITAVDDNGNEATKVQKVIGVKAPEVRVTTDQENFIIRASDENEIEKIVINLNGQVTEKTVNQKQYEEKVKANNGENKLIVTVYNKNGITKTSKIKWTKE